MQQRYYDPGIGVFLSIDPISANRNPLAQFNRYRYANSNPYKFYDPDGRESREGIGCTGSRVGCPGGTQGAPQNSVGYRRSFESAMRGIAGHQEIAKDIQRGLPDAEVKTERRSYNPFSKKFYRIDVMVRVNENSPWMVFEIKPLTGLTDSPAKNASADRQLRNYISTLRANNIRAEVGNWDSLFSESTRVAYRPAGTLGGVSVGGSYLYGPSPNQPGIIEYQVGVYPFSP